MRAQLEELEKLEKQVAFLKKETQKIQLWSIRSKEGPFSRSDMMDDENNDILFSSKEKAKAAIVQAGRKKELCAHLYVAPSVCRGATPQGTF